MGSAQFLCSIIFWSGPAQFSHSVLSNSHFELSTLNLTANSTPSSEVISDFTHNYGMGSELIPNFTLNCRLDSAHCLYELGAGYRQFLVMPLNYHHLVPPARISLTLSRHFSLSFIAFGRSSRLHFLFLIFLRTELSSSLVNGPSLMSNCLLIILVIGSFVTFGGFPSRFLKCCFNSFTLSCWLAAFNFALAVLFFYSLRLLFARLS